MSELILHAAHLSEAHQLRFSYLFDVAAKRWRETQSASSAKPATELWVIDAQSAPTAISQRPDNACVLLIANDDQAEALRAQWPHQIDGQLPPDYSVGRLTQMLEQMSLQAHGKRLRETLKNRRQQGMTTQHDVQIKNADAVFLKATTLEEAPAAATDALPEPAAGTRFRIKRWTQLTGSMAGQAHRQVLASLISGERSLQELRERSPLEHTELLRLLQVLRGKGVLVETAPNTAAVAALPANASQPAAPIQAPAATAAAPAGNGLARSLFRQLSRWIGQSRNETAT
ncbi:hypothetical protein ACFIQF_11180 [Comamonas sp. J-3]|uniref:hypothetical protein n=1 Tax=Comamonas trifloxystrobinivorans TaxID=3350256 RepID=UPI003729F7B9